MEPTLKPGHKSTEFWGKTLAEVFVLIGMFIPDANIDPKSAFQIVTAIEIAYTIGRSIVKYAHQKFVAPVEARKLPPSVK